MHWPELDRGGHLAALEAPELLADDIPTLFRRLPDCLTLFFREGFGVPGNSARTIEAIGG